MKTLIKQLRTVFRKNPQIVVAYIIGSYAKKTLRPESDFDLVVLVNNKINLNFESLYKSIQHLKFPKNLDLSVIDLQSSPLFLYETISAGKKIYERSTYESTDNEAKILHRYYDNQHIRNIYYSYLKNKFT